MGRAPAQQPSEAETSHNEYHSFFELTTSKMNYIHYGQKETTSVKLGRKPAHAHIPGPLERRQSRVDVCPRRTATGHPRSSRSFCAEGALSPFRTDGPRGMVAGPSVPRDRR